ncbi:unnamed protein product [Bursaphelenchus okinawaensis]|uniref:G protein-coupled receptor n=1 Tax=Bursaphelenchus okinawaensis TaxID=465554 RepID=A0A811KDA1_9BILA|nr:unnamed protein product [Bursaphelenchus okinawaensis]CAG9101545.1 unnamed protein product [Bursaphelenchus okinawaensis]
MDWLFYHEINEYFVISLCLILNALQLTLALTERQQVVKVYCKLIVLNASTELCSTFCMALGRPILQFRNGLFVVVFLGREKDANLYLVFFFYAIGVGIGIITLLMDFLYRYMVVCRDTNVRLYHILSWTLIVYFFAAWDATFLTYGFYTSTEGTNATLHSIFTDVPYFLKLEDVPVLFTDVYNQYSRIFMVSALMITNTVYSVVFFTRHKVMTKLFSKKHVMSQRTKIMQNGLNNMLMAQAIVPIFTGLLPVIGIVLGQLH